MPFTRGAIGASGLRGARSLSIAAAIGDEYGIAIDGDASGEPAHRQMSQHAAMIRVDYRDCIDTGLCC